MSTHSRSSQCYSFTLNTGAWVATCPSFWDMWCMGVLCACMSVHHVHAWCLKRPEEGISWNWTADGCKLPCWCRSSRRADSTLNCWIISAVPINHILTHAKTALLNCFCPLKYTFIIPLEIYSWLRDSLQVLCMWGPHLFKYFLVFRLLIFNKVNHKITNFKHYTNSFSLTK